MSVGGPVLVDGLVYRPLEHVRGGLVAHPLPEVHAADLVAEDAEAADVRLLDFVDASGQAVLHGSLSRKHELPAGAHQSRPGAEYIRTNIGRRAALNTGPVRGGPAAAPGGERAA